MRTENEQVLQAQALLAINLRTWRQPLACPSEVLFALGISLLWTLLYNFSFWQQTWQAMWHPTLSGVGFMVSVFVVVIAVQTILLLLMPSRTALRAFASMLFILAATSSYFCSEYGAIMNKDMLRNVLETDAHEIGGLISFHLFLWIAALGVAPALLIWRISLPEMSWSARLRERTWAVGLGAAVCLAALFSYSANYAVFFREHKPIRFTLMPIAPISSLLGVVSASSTHDAHRPLLNPAGHSQRVGLVRPRPLVLFVVVGETARAANFELGGYDRATNSELESIHEVVYFNHATSCATSTALSVPCMFSHLGRDQFDINEVNRYTNLLDALAQAEFTIEWRENNAGCKGVCNRVSQITYSASNEGRLCRHSYCHDEIMLTDLQQRLASIDRDTVFVFHQIGSHGPAYRERYPPEFERFKPACHSNELQHCTEQEILNAYDNSIAYTDHVLARQIELLSAASERLDGLLIYASDHGESLGEQGVYLHGLPYTFAPRTQKEIPMLLWASQGYQNRTGVRAECLRKHAFDVVSHDNLYHTILGAAEVRNQVYDPKLDLLSACRPPVLGSHE